MDATSAFTREVEVIAYQAFFGKFSRYCQVESQGRGCTKVVEAFCWNAKHMVCERHHALFHEPDGSPMSLERIDLPAWR